MFEKPHQKANPADNSFRRLNQMVLDCPDDGEGLHQFFQAAVASNNFEEAKQTFARMLRQYPGNHTIRRLMIALCLHQKDYPSAMESIETLVAYSTPDDMLLDNALQVRTEIGPLTIDAASDRPSLSLCMIVKNEQARLGPCLNAVKQLADEIIIVDTGSTDRTKDVAFIYGARVYAFPWCHDFSAARNVSLQKACGDWILILDADELIAPSDQPSVRQLMQHGATKPTAFLFHTRNYSHLTNGLDWHINDEGYPDHEAGVGWFPSVKVRLFPRFEDIRFRYPVHELVEPALKTAGIPVSSCDIPIHHYGNLNDERRREKAHRYFNLGYAKLEILGDDPVAVRELAVEAGQIERWHESIELWQRFLSLCPDNGEAFANLSGAYWQIGKYHQGKINAQKAIQDDPDLHAGQYNLAANLLMLKRFKDTLKVLFSLLERCPSYLAAQFLLAVTYTILGETRQSLPLFKQLASQLSGDGLNLAIQEISAKLHAAGQTDSVKILTNTVKQLRHIPK